MLTRAKVALPILLFALCAGGPAGAAEIDEPAYSGSDYQAFSRDDCLACHDDPDLEGDTERGATLELYVDETILDGSVHAERL
jgi:mono/diheme cytochrome c family protein